MRIFNGYKLQFSDEPHPLEVVGSYKIRKTYWYITKRPNGDRVSIMRDRVLEDLQSGNLQVTL
jgi:hypothetical protein